MASRYYAGLGRRKTSVARVRIYPGEEGFVINGVSADEYFSRDWDVAWATKPLRVTKTEGDIRITVQAKGGGMTGQSGAIRLGLARALVAWNEEFHGPLRGAGLLTRDPRMKERKKPGLKGARKAPQYTKR
ncbi:MAG: 30S ribosomal protein S9 [Chloroflexota bacterium]|nr:30S ribosomal protein S9 [Chloroflexota bacterium]